MVDLNCDDGLKSYRREMLECFDNAGFVLSEKNACTTNLEKVCRIYPRDALLNILSFFFCICIVSICLNNFYEFIGFDQFPRLSLFSNY